MVIILQLYFTPVYCTKFFTCTAVFNALVDHQSELKVKQCSIFEVKQCRYV